MFKDEKDFKKIMESAGFATTSYDDKYANIAIFSKMLFEKHDVSKTGSLSYDEFYCMLNFMHKINNAYPPEEEMVKDAFAGFDVNEDGKVSSEEITIYFRKRNDQFDDAEHVKKMMEDLKNLNLADHENRLVSFSKMLMEEFDVSKTGSFSYEEFKVMLHFVMSIFGGAPLSEKEDKTFFAKFDENDDGKVSLEEATAFFRKMCYEQFADEEEYKKLMEKAGVAIQAEKDKKNSCIVF